MKLTEVPFEGLPDTACPKPDKLLQTKPNQYRKAIAKTIMAYKILFIRSTAFCYNEYN